MTYLVLRLNSTIVKTILDTHMKKLKLIDLKSKWNLPKKIRELIAIWDNGLLSIGRVGTLKVILNLIQSSIKMEDQNLLKLDIIKSVNAGILQFSK